MGSLRIASRLAASWVAKLADLQTRMRNDPSHGTAWRWQIQAKVLRFLILRYGGDSSLDLVDDPQPLAESLIESLPIAQSCFHLRTQAELRRLLEEIAEINRWKTV